MSDLKDWWRNGFPLSVQHKFFEPTLLAWIDRFFAIFSRRVEGSISRDRRSPEAALKLSSDTENDRKEVARCVLAPHRAFERVSLHDAGAAPEALRYLFETASLTLPSSFKDSLSRPAMLNWCSNAIRSVWDHREKHADKILRYSLVNNVQRPLAEFGQLCRVDVNGIRTPRICVMEPKIYNPKKFPKKNVTKLTIWQRYFV